MSYREKKKHQTDTGSMKEYSIPGNTIYDYARTTNTMNES